MQFSNIDFVKNLGIDDSFFRQTYKLNRKNFYGQYTENEKNFLVNFLARIIKPRGILEFSSSRGYSTILMAKAIKDNNLPIDFFQSHEMSLKCVNAARGLMSRNEIDFVKIKLGDVFETMDRKKLTECDLLFVDSDHSGRFAERYAKEFFPILRPGAWVFVHDICFAPENEEAACVRRYIQENNISDYFYLPDILELLGVADDELNPYHGKSIDKTVTLCFRQQKEEPK